MNHIKTKLAYLNGLAEGINLSNDGECALITGIIDVISDLNDEIQDISSRVDEVEEYMDAIDEDLQDMELEYYDELADEMLNMEDVIEEEAEIEERFED